VNESIGLSKAHSGVNNIKIAFLDSWLKKGAVLDAGCGNGLYGLHCADKGCDVVICKGSRFFKFWNYFAKDDIGQSLPGFPQDC